MSKNPRLTIVSISLVGVVALSSHAQELTPEQRSFMGLPASGPLAPKHSAPVAPSLIATPTPSTGQLASGGPAMTFRIVGTGGASCCEWVAADGVITIDTPQVFKAFLSSIGKDGPALQETITFNSPGGDFFAALALGRAIRRDTHMWTGVGRTEAEASDAAGGPRAYRTSGGVCLSSCVLAFMGGKTRLYLRGTGDTQQTLALRSFAIDQPASVIGRQSADAMDGGGLPTPGLLRLAIEGYVTEMGVSPSIISLMETPNQPGGVRALSQEEADVMGLNTPVAARTKWSLAARHGGLALYGSGDDRWTHYTLGLECVANQRGALEYTIGVPVEVGERSMSTAQDGYRQGIEGVVVEAGGVSLPGQIKAVQLLSGKLLVTTWLAAPQVAVIRGGGADITFDVPHSLANVLPSIPLGAPQVTEVIDLLLRNCPSQ